LTDAIVNQKGEVHGDEQPLVPAAADDSAALRSRKEERLAIIRRLRKVLHRVSGQIRPCTSRCVCARACAHSSCMSLLFLLFSHNRFKHSRTQDGYKSDALIASLVESITHPTLHFGHSRRPCLSSRNEKTLCAGSGMMIGPPILMNVLCPGQISQDIRRARPEIKYFEISGVSPTPILAQIDSPFDFQFQIRSKLYHVLQQINTPPPSNDSIRRGR
jgi:hypothetical protein